MKGAHRIIVESKKIRYDFTIKRNITILTGDSGSGKTLLIDFIRDYRRYGTDSGIVVSCDLPCRTLDSEDWERQLEGISGSIIFIDEGSRFLASKKFAELALKSDNYFVLATREKLPMLPYSVREIYGFRESGKFHEAKQKYNEIYNLYGEISETDGINPHLVITEDSNSGYEFFNELCRQKNISCISANGKSNILKVLKNTEATAQKILVIADGAALGSEMREIMRYLDSAENAALYAPESFEWLLLSTNAIPDVNVSAILQKPENYIESEKYASWEQFFTKLLSEQTQGNPIWSYSKRKLARSYLSSRIVTAAKKVMHLIIWD